MIATAFGTLAPFERVPGRGAEADLYKVFLGRSALMGWSRMGSSESPPIPLLWGMNEAELTLDGGLQIGFVQVGLDNGLSMAIPPLIQGTDDSLRWFGEAAIDSWEITAVDISPNQPSNLFDLLDASNWFPRAVGNPTRAVVTLAVDRGDEQVTQTILNDLQRNSAAPFDFEPLVDLPREHAGAREWPPISWVVTDTGLTLTLPEWSPEAIGWVAARVAESALSLESPPRHFSVRVTRIAPE